MRGVPQTRSRRSSRLVGAFAVAVWLAALVPLGSASAYTTIGTSGKNGAWSIADNDTQASLLCAYEGEDLAQLTVSAPTIWGIARTRRKVGWQFQVLRDQWWRQFQGNSYVAYQSPMVKAWAKRARAATFAPQTWSVPAEWRTSYESFKVRVTMKWFQTNGVSLLGSKTIELEYNAAAQSSPASPSFAPGVGAGPCTGSFSTVAPPPVDHWAPVPAGFERFTHWRPYWKNFSAGAVNSMIAELQSMEQTGVILTGLESKNRYALPANVDQYLTMIRDAGIKPYLALWVARFSDAELANTMRAWNAGNGKWAGIVLDVEAGLENFATADRPAAVQALNKFMTQIRPLTPFIAYAPWAQITDHPVMLYPELNGWCDAFMPQLYFNYYNNDPVRMLDGLEAALDYEAPKWPDPPIPVIPVVNDWGPNLNVDKLHRYIDIALARYGAVSGWRLHPDMKEEVKDLWGSLTPP